MNPLLHYMQYGHKEGRRVPEEKYLLPPNLPAHLGKREKEKIRASVQQQVEQARVLQDARIVQEYPRDTKKLIVLLVPPADIINGGCMSICSIAHVTRELADVHGSQVIVATTPSINTFANYTMFDAGFDIYRFEQLNEYFTDLDEVQIHIPENHCVELLRRISAQSVAWLDRIPVRRANILNQNIKLLPDVIIVDYLKRFFTETTMTIAHQQYCTRQLRSSYDLSVHFLSTSNLVEYHYRPPHEKEQLLLYSPDESPYKDAVLDSIREKHPELELREIKAMNYGDYLATLSRAKWMITFGEGVDGYFLESARSGAIPFAVYNFDFFDDRFDGLPTVYETYADMLEKIASDITRYGDPEVFSALSRQLIELDSVVYDDDEYRENIRQFYLGNYTLPIEEAHALQRRNLEEQPLISVVLATYNGERFLKGQLTSLNKSTYKNIEIIISDDGSTDATMDILKAFPFKHPVTIVTNSGTHGPVGNFNNAMSLAKGKYWALCDQDDIWYAKKLETLLAHIEDYDVIQGRLRAIDSDGQQHESAAIRRMYETDRSRQYRFADFVFESPILGSAALVRADLVRELLPIPDEVIFHDWWIVLNAIKRNGICYTDKEVIKYRQHGENVAYMFFNTPGFHQRLLQRSRLIAERLGDRLSRQERVLLALSRNWYGMYECFSKVMPQWVYPYFHSNTHALTGKALASIQETAAQMLKEGAGED
ncbi:MAG: glycosyltransferase [Coriobacteriales bacterium]|nr:glycosyltransferase [Coriobacteriales bacterium]